MPPVAIDPNDRRIWFLGELAGYSHQDAFFRLATLRSRCVELGTDRPSLVELRACLGRDGDTHLVEAGLGELEPNGGVRVLLEHEGKRASAASHGGRARAAAAQRDQRGRMIRRSLDEPSPAETSETPAETSETPAETSETPADDQRSSSDPPAIRVLSLLSSSDLPPEELPDPRAITSAELAPTAPRPAAQLRDRRVKLNHDAWQYAALIHARLRDEGVSPDAVPWPPMPAGAPMSDLVERTKELLAATPEPNYEAAGATIRRRVDVASAEAKREGHLRWFTPSRLWDAKGFWRALELTVEEAGQRRPPARASPPDTPSLRRITTFKD